MQSGLSHIESESSRAVRTCKHAHTRLKPDYSVPYSLLRSAVNKQLRNPSPPHPPPNGRRQRGCDYVTALLYTLLQVLVF